MLARLRVVTHLVMRRMIRVHVLEFAMRTGTGPVTNASGVSLRAACDETAFMMVAVLRGEGDGRREAKRRTGAEANKKAD